MAITPVNNMVSEVQNISKTNDTTSNYNVDPANGMSSNIVNKLGDEFIQTVNKISGSYVSADNLQTSMKNGNVSLDKILEVQDLMQTADNETLLLSKVASSVSHDLDTLTTKIQ